MNDTAIDWVSDFVKRFGHKSRINRLQAEKFHGSVALNFSDGKVININQQVKIIDSEDV